VLRCAGRAQTGGTPLHCAAASDKVSIIMLLLELGVDMGAKDNVRAAKRSRHCGFVTYARGRQLQIAVHTAC
jgi:hypothetical protein